MELRAELKYSKSHEWIKEDGDDKRDPGLTDYAQSEFRRSCIYKPSRKLEMK